MLLRVCKTKKFMAQCGTQTRHLQLPNSSDTEHMSYTSHHRLCKISEHKLEHHGQNQEKEKNPTTDLKNFDGKYEVNYKSATSYQQQLSIINLCSFQIYYLKHLYFAPVHVRKKWSNTNLV